MKAIIIRDYFSGKILKKVKYPAEHSVSYGVEGNYFVIRDYFTDEILKKVKRPMGSIEFYPER